MRTLANSADQVEILARTGKLRPDTPRKWGRMSCPQMVCHLNDCFRLTFGERPTEPIDTLFTRTVIKGIALYSPFPWPHGYRSRPEYDQERGGTAPTSFENDLDEFRKLFARFVREGAKLRWRHPSFGEMSTKDSFRWAYLHIDHHLRQFGA